MTESVDANAHRILGWLGPSRDGNSVSVDSTGTAAVASSVAADAYSSDSDENDFEEIHKMVRTTGEGFDDFRRAAQILLSKDQGRIQFVPTDAMDTARDPFLIVRGYFRLIRVALEPAPISADGTPPPVSEDDLLRLALSLLKQLGTTLKLSVQTALDAVTRNNEEASSGLNSLRRNETILYYLKNSLRHIHPQVSKHVKLLGPTYRSFCDISEAFISILKFEKSNLENIASNFESIVEWKTLKQISMEVDKLKLIWKMTGMHLSSAVMHLLKFLDDGLTNLQAALVSCTASGDGCNSVQILSPDGQSKIMIFLLARVTSLICTKRHYRVCIMRSSDNEDVLEDDEKQLMKEAILRLFRIRGLSVAAGAILAGGNDDERHTPLFKMTAGLGVLTERYLGKLLELSDLENSDHGMITYMGIDSLTNLSCLVLHCGEAPIKRLETECAENLMFADPVPLGKLFMDTHVLKILLPPSPSYHDSMTTKRPRSTAVLKLCESILFADIPACYQYLIKSGISTSKCNPKNWVTNLLSDCIIIIEHATHVLFIPKQPTAGENYFTAELMKKSTKLQHKLLISWLAESSPENNDLGNNCSRNHPLTNEIILETIHRRITSSLVSNAQFAKQDSLSLAALSSQLLFHCHTTTRLRRNISTLLSRVLLRFRKIGVRDGQFCCEVSLQDQNSLVQRIWQELFKSTLWKPQFANSSKEKSRSKRKLRLKLKSPSCGYSMDDIFAIIPVLEALSRYAHANVTYDVNGEIGQHMKCYWEEVLAKKGKDSSAKDDNFLKMMILTYLSTGALNTSSTIASCLLPLVRDEISTSLSSSKFLDSVLAHIERQLNSAITPRTRRALVKKHACTHFLSNLAVLKEEEWSEAQVRRAVDILVKVHDIALLNTSPDHIQLIHSTVRSASKLGCIMRSEFSQETLMVSEGTTMYFDVVNFMLSQPVPFFCSQPLIDSINKVLGKSKWFYVAPTVSSLEHFLRALPPNHRGLMPTTMPTAARLLLTSRMKGQLYDITCKETTDGQGSEYLFADEHKFLLWFCSRKIESCLGGRRLYLTAGSKVLLPRDKNGGIFAVVVTEAGETSKTPEQIIKSLDASKCDVHKMKSSGEILISDV